MRSPRDLPAVRRLNAPTRTAATRRRRVRKVVAALLSGSAVLVVLAPSGHGGAADHGDASPAVAGRQVVSVPADPALAAALTPSSRVDLWDAHGHALATRAPVVTSDTRGGGTGATPSDGSHVLVAIRPDEMAHLARDGGEKPGVSSDVTVSISQ